MARTSRRTTQDILESIRTEGRDIRIILIRNIIIASVSGMILLFLLPIIWNALITPLWIYSHENILIQFDPIVVTGSGTGLGGFISGTVITQLFSQLIITAKYLAVLTFRIARFTYLVILSIIIIYTLIYSLLSILMQNKIKARVVVLSVIIGAFISIGISFFLIPNDQLLLNTLVSIIQELSESSNIIEQIPVVASDIILSYYIGIVITIGLNLLITSTIQIGLRKIS